MAEKDDEISLLRVQVKSLARALVEPQALDEDEMDAVIRMAESVNKSADICDSPAKMLLKIMS